MHIPDTRLGRALMEIRIAEAERTALRDGSRVGIPERWAQIENWWHEFIESMTIRPPKLPGGGNWHRPLHH